MSTAAPPAWSLVSDVTSAPAPAAPTPRAVGYQQSVQRHNYDSAQQTIGSYVRGFADFWNLPITEIDPRSGQPRQAPMLNSDLSPADKLLILGAGAAKFLLLATTAASVCATLIANIASMAGRTLPTMPAGYQFDESAGDGTVKLQQATITGSTVTWVNVQPTPAGVAAAIAAGIAIPAWVTTVAAT